METRSNHTLIVFAALVALGLVAPLFVYPVFLMKVLCFALFACAFNLLIGYVGLLSFGHAMFFGFAAYISGYSVKVLGWPTEVGILAGTAVAAALGLVVGAIAIRRQGIYFAMVTLALSQMVFFFCLQAKFTGGEDGIQAIPRRPLLGVLNIANDFVFYYVVLAIFCIGFLIIWRTIHSPFGQVLKAIRENEPRAISLGYAVDRFKLIAFVLSAALAGLAGATKAIVFQLASLTDVAWQMSGEVVLMTLVGGMGTVFGPIVGAGIIITMQNYLAGFGEWVLVIQGAIFVVTVLLFRRGIVGEIMALAQYMQRRSRAGSARRLRPGVSCGIGDPIAACYRGIRAQKRLDASHDATHCRRTCFFQEAVGPGPPLLVRRGATAPRVLGLFDHPQGGVDRARAAGDHHLGLSVLIVYLAKLFNDWNARFFNALQDKNAEAFWAELLYWVVLAASSSWPSSTACS